MSLPFTFTPLLFDTIDAFLPSVIDYLILRFHCIAVLFCCLLTDTLRCLPDIYDAITPIFPCLINGHYLTPFTPRHIGDYHWLLFISSSFSDAI